MIINLKDHRDTVADETLVPLYREYESLTLELMAKLNEIEDKERQLLSVSEATDAACEESRLVRGYGPFFVRISVRVSFLTRIKKSSAVGCTGSLCINPFHVSDGCITTGGPTSIDVS